MKNFIPLTVFLLFCTAQVFAQFPPNTDTAFIGWYNSIQAAAYKGDAHAQKEFAFIYMNGKGGLNVDYAIAADFFKQSAQKGNDTAQAMYGLMCLEGLGVAKNKPEGAKWLEKASQQGNAAAAANLGMMYMMGNGVKKDPAKGVLLMRMSADKGYSTGQNALGVYYSTDGPHRDLSQAAALFRKAAMQGNLDAANNLGVALEYGKGVPKDLTEARKWYILAASKGDKDAIDNMNNFWKKYPDELKKFEQENGTLPQTSATSVSTGQNTNPYTGKKICAIEIGTGQGHTGALNAYCETVVATTVNNKALGLPKNIVSSAVFAQDVAFDGFGVVEKNTPVKFFDQLIFIITENMADREYWETTNAAILRCLGNPKEFTTATDQDFLFWGHAEPIRVPAGSKILMGYQVLMPAGRYMYDIRAMEAVVSRDITVSGLGTVRKGQSIITKKFPYVKGEEPYDGSIVIQ